MGGGSLGNRDHYVSFISRSILRKAYSKADNVPICHFELYGIIGAERGCCLGNYATCFIVLKCCSQRERDC